jgi:hypothetical protein
MLAIARVAVVILLGGATSAMDQGALVSTIDGMAPKAFNQRQRREPWK